jgi:hypothetical protein
MRALYSRHTGEVEILGTPKELHELAGALKGHEESSFELDSVDDPAPYTDSLRLIEITRDVGQVDMEVSGPAAPLRLHGGPQQLSMLGDVVEQFALEGDPSSHLHVEGFPGHEFLAESLQGLVIGLVP